MWVGRPLFFLLFFCLLLRSLSLIARVFFCVWTRRLLLLQEWPVWFMSLGLKSYANMSDKGTVSPKEKEATEKRGRGRPRKQPQVKTSDVSSPILFFYLLEKVCCCIFLLLLYPRNYNKDVFNIIKMGADFFLNPLTQVCCSWCSGRYYCSWASHAYPSMKLRLLKWLQHALVTICPFLISVREEQQTCHMSHWFVSNL